MSSLKLYGVEILQDNPVPESPIPIDEISSDSSITYTYQGATTTGAPWFMNNVNSMPMDIAAKEENKLITQYRNLLLTPEVDICIEEIVHESIIFPKNGEYAIEADLSNIEDSVIPEKTKEAIKDEFKLIYDMLLFNRKGHDIFKRWLVDSRIAYYKNIDLENLDDGIQSLTYIDPRKYKKVQQSNRKIDPETGRLVVNNYKEFFFYNENGIKDLSEERNKSKASSPHSYNPNQGGKFFSSSSNSAMGNNYNTNASINTITKDSIAYAPSGITDSSGKMVIGYLHRALKVANNLQMMEDSMLIYKLSRAPERRVFYVDTGNLPKAKAEQYVKSIADKYRTKMVYDARTGEIENNRNFMALTEDYWLARQGGSRGTEISTLPGGMQTGDTDESEYFKSKLYDALGVPASRFSEQPPLFNASTMITRDEVRFSRLISRLRSNFNVLFEDILGTQLTLKNIITTDEWQEIRNKISFIYAEDNYFKEAIALEKNSQIANMIGMWLPYVGKIVSMEYLYKNVMQFTDDDISEIQRQIIKEAKTNNEVKLAIKQTENEIKSIEIQQEQQELGLKQQKMEMSQMQDSGQEEQQERPQTESVNSEFENAINEMFLV